MIYAGRLRNKVIVQTPTEIADTYGQSTTTWATYLTTWASIETPSGRESILSGQPQGQLSHVLRMRYAAGVTSKMRVLFGTRVFNIGSIVNVDQRNEELQLVCTEVL